MFPHGFLSMVIIFVEILKSELEMTRWVMFATQALGLELGSPAITIKLGGGVGLSVCPQPLLGACWLVSLPSCIVMVSSRFSASKNKKMIE